MNLHLRAIGLIWLSLFSVFAFAQDGQENNVYRMHIEALTNPKTSGRLPGTEGFDISKDYIINEFKKAGVGPLQKDDYTAPFSLIKMSVYQRDQSKFSCATEKEFFQMASNEDYHPVFFSESKTLPDKDVVFVGYGITDKDYDDYAGVDVKDKIVLMMRYDYTESAGENYNALAGAVLNAKLKNAADRGALAILIFNGFNSFQQGTRDIFYKPRFHYAIKEDMISTPFFYLKHEAMAVVEKATGLNFSEIQKEIDTKKKPKSFLIPNFKVQLKCQFKDTFITTTNVSAIIGGSDPQLRNEYIVVGAHFDHVGLGEFGSRTGSNGSHQIHPGADDNASGVSVLIELAKTIPRMNPKRSVILVGFTAEEMGLFGSEMFLRKNEALVPKIKAMVNLDMVGCYRERIGVRVNGADTCLLFRKSLETAFKDKLKLSYTMYSPANAMSDHESFFERKIPSVHFFTGFHERYHHTTDTVDFLNFEGLRQLTVATAQFVVDMANAKEGLELDKNYSPKPLADTGINLLKDNSRTKILSIVEGSPAAKAGLLPGDIILQVDQINLLSPFDFLNIARDYAAGSKMPILIMREAKGTIEKIEIELDL